MRITFVTFSRLIYCSIMIIKTDNGCKSCSSSWSFTFFNPLKWGNSFWLLTLCVLLHTYLSSFFSIFIRSSSGCCKIVKIKENRERKWKKNHFYHWITWVNIFIYFPRVSISSVTVLPAAAPPHMPLFSSIWLFFTGFRGNKFGILLIHGYVRGENVANRIEYHQ